MLLVVQDPEQVSSFVGYVKQEIAHAINRLLGRKQKTIWKSEYDSPVVLDYDKTLSVVAYIYSNCAQAGLLESIKDYPGVSSWNMLKNNNTSTWYPCFSRDSIPQLMNPAKPYLEDKNVYNKLLSESKLSSRLDVNHFSWKKHFPESAHLSDEYIKAELLQRISKTEEALKAERIAENKYVMGLDALRCSSMLKEYTPKKHGKKMICLASTKELRVKFITFYKQTVKKAEDVFERWKKLDFSVPYPVGLFMPRRPRTINALSWNTALYAYELAPAAAPSLAV